MKDEVNKGVIGQLGGIHTYWFKNTSKVVFILILFIFSLGIYSYFLGIAFNFGEKEEYRGFITSINWFPSLIITIPISIYLLKFFFYLLEDAIFSLDNILIPVNNNNIKFSEKLINSFISFWKMRIIPISVILTIALVLVADYYSIFSIFYISSVSEKDWSNFGFIVYSDKNKFFYLVFNILAFFLEWILMYITSIVFFSSIYPLLVFVKSGVTKEHRKGSILHNYKLKWKYDDPHGRCGLHKLDRVFIVYIAMIVFGLIAVFISMVANFYLLNGIDLGVLLLLVIMVLLLPASFIWIIFPYWTNFPQKLPMEEELSEEFRNKTLPDPKPWPLGDGVLIIGVLGIIGTIIGLSLKMLLR